MWVLFSGCRQAQSCRSGQFLHGTHRDANEILARFEGTDYIGIVPHSVISPYCESLFPEKYGRVIDFMHVYEEDLELWGDDIEWLPIEDALLADRHGGCLTEGE